MRVKLAEEPCDALVSADEEDAAAVQLGDEAGPAAAPGYEADSAASGGSADESVSAAESEPGTNSAAAAWLANEPCSFAVKPVGWTWLEAAVKSLDESCFAEAPAGEPCPASGPRAASGLVGEGRVEGDLKCFERRTAHCEGSWQPSEGAGRGCRPTL